MSKSLIGSDSDQVPVNGMLGTLAFQDHQNVNIKGGKIGGVEVDTIAQTILSGEEVDTIASSSSLVLRGGETNLLTYSEQFDNAAWTKSNATITADAAVAPDGTMTADKLIEDTANSTHGWNQNTSVTSGVSYVASVFVKAGERTIVRVATGSGLGTKVAFVDIANGTITSESGTGTASVRSVGNGVYRISLSVVATLTTSAGLFVRLVSTGTTFSYLGDGTSGLYIWGAKLNEGTDPGAYLKTEAHAINTPYAAPIESPNGVALPLKATMTPARNSDMTFELTNNTTLTVKVKGSDGIVRSVALTLA